MHAGSAVSAEVSDYWVLGLLLFQVKFRAQFEGLYAPWVLLKVLVGQTEDDHMDAYLLLERKERRKECTVCMNYYKTTTDNHNRTKQASQPVETRNQALDPTATTAKATTKAISCKRSSSSNGSSSGSQSVPP